MNVLASLQYNFGGFNPRFAHDFADTMQVMSNNYDITTSNVKDPRTFLLGLLQFQNNLGSVPAIQMHQGKKIGETIMRGSIAFANQQAGFDVNGFVSGVLGEYATLSLFPDASKGETFFDVAMRLQYEAAVRQLRYSSQTDLSALNKQRDAASAMNALLSCLTYFGYEDAIPAELKARATSIVGALFPKDPTTPVVAADLEQSDIGAFLKRLKESGGARGVALLPKEDNRDLEELSKALLKHRLHGGVAKRIPPYIPQVIAPQQALPLVSAAPVLPEPKDHPMIDGHSRRLMVQASVVDRSTVKASYEITPENEANPLGRGGLGVVYKAKMVLWDPDSSAHRVRDVAIKVTQKGAYDREVAWDCFKHDLIIQGGILERVPGVVKVYDAGLTAAGDPFMVMELIEGETFEQLVDRVAQREEAFDLEKTMRYLSQAARTLSILHALEIFHRDIKPSNIFLARVDGQEKLEVRVSDFGVSKNQKERDSVIGAGAAVGTPEYMAPELLAPNFNAGAAFQIEWIKRAFKNLDEYRMDVYSFGVMAYEALSGGYYPYGDAKVENLVRNYCQDVPPPPAPLREVNPTGNIPAALADIIHKCCAINPDDRYAKMQEVLFAMTNYNAESICEDASARYRNLERRVDTKTEAIEEHEYEQLTLEWVNLFLEGIKEYEHNYRLYPDEKLKGRLLQRLSELFDWADPLGRNDIMKLCVEKALALDPEKKNAATQSMNQGIRIAFDFIGRIPGQQGAAIKAEVMRDNNFQGTFVSDPLYSGGKLKGRPTEQAPLVLERGFRYRANLVIDGAADISYLLPARPREIQREGAWVKTGEGGTPLTHKITIPILPKIWLPSDEWVVGLPGEYAAWQEAASFSERIENIRKIENPFLLGPLVTSKAWYDFWSALRLKDEGVLSLLREVNPAIVAVLAQAKDEFIDNLFWPTDWASAGGWDQSGFANLQYHTIGVKVDSDAPVSYVKPEAAQIFLDYQTALYRQTPGRPTTHKIRLIRLTEWKASVRGFTAQMAPWGDEAAVGGAAAIHGRPSRFERRRGMKAQRIVPMGVHEKGHADYATFWRKGPSGKFEPTIAHIAGNVSKMVSLSPLERQRMMTSFALTSEELDARIIATGVTFDSVAGKWIDGIDPKTKTINAGIMPVLEIDPEDLLRA